MKTFVVSLSEIGPHDLERAGWKAFNLSVLQKRGLPTPPGFVVTAEALRKFMDHNDLERKLNDLSTSEATEPQVAVEQGRYARSLFDAAEWPKPVAAAVDRAVMQLALGSARAVDEITLAVRSSFSGEDEVTASFAGQMATVLNVHGRDRLLQAIVHCWTSLWSAQALSYRALRGRITEPLGGVLVQLQLEPRWAGVAIAADALGGREQILVEAVRSIGKPVVSGSADPHRLVVVPDGNSGTPRSYHPASQEPEMSEGVRKSIAHSAARLFRDAPQYGDFEWALTDDRFYVLQARPLSASETSWAPPRDDILWSRVLSEEFWSGPVTPLMFSMVGTVIEDAMLRRPVSMLGASHLSRGPYLRLVYDHVFVNLNALKPIIQMIPSWALTEELLKMFPPDERVTIRQNAGVILPMDLPVGVVRFSRKGAPWWFGHAAARFASFVRTKIPLVQNYKPPAPTEPASRFHESAQWLLGLLDQYLETTVWGVTYAYILVPLAKRLIEMWFPAHISQHLVRTTLSNLPSDMNLETGRRLADLAVRLAETELLERIRKEEPQFQKAERMLAASDGGEGFLEAFRDFLSAFGHRAVDRDILAPRWADDPQIPFSLICKLAQSTPPRVREPMSDREVKRTLRDALPAGRRTLLEPIKAPALGLSVKLARQFLPIRENMRFYADVFLYALRKLALARADGLIEKGLLPPAERNLVFFMTHRDLFSEIMDRPATRADALIQSARSRSERFHLHRNRPLPLYVLNGQDYEALMEPDRTGRQLTGLPASPGLGRGRVRKAEGYKDFLSFRPGEVLVVPYLDPSWSSLIFHAKAVITEVGGQLSHGAIVAREYGVPAVVGVAGAMQILSDGQEVIVDGSKGQVRVIS